MNIYISSDHAGFTKKQKLAQMLAKNYSVIDLGPETLNPSDDYPVFAERIGNAVTQNPDSFGIILCASGQGVEIAANKIDGVRAALVWKPHLAVETRNDNNSNVLALPSEELSVEEMFEISQKFIQTPFSTAPRHQRRVDEITQLEEEN